VQNTFTVLREISGGYNFWILVIGNHSGNKFLDTAPQLTLYGNLRKHTLARQVKPIQDNSTGWSWVM